MAVHEGTSSNFAQLIASNKLVLVDYWADWCAPCKQLSPIIDELAREFESDLEVVKVDTSAHPDLATAQGIMALPTLQFYSGGSLVKSLAGGQTKRALTRTIESLI